MNTTAATTTDIVLTEAELAFIADANAKPTPAVVFVHGLWLHASSWEPWVARFRGLGLAAFAPGWPGDGATAAETREHPERVAGVGLDAVVARYRAVIDRLERRPILIGHSFGGLIVQLLLGQGYGAAAIAIDPAQGKGVWALPPVQLWNALPVLGNPTQFRGANMPSQARFAQAFGNRLSREESDALYAAVVIPSPGRPLFEAGAANLAPHSPAAVAVDADRGPLLVIGGGKDRTVPASTARRVFRTYRHATTVNEYKEFPDRGHSLVLDSGWREIADYAVEWLRFVGVVEPEAAGDAANAPAAEAAPTEAVA
ncbi:alpha/beta fold hydrolase [Agromyces sp. CFH 90414]|uniref:Alpha/beta fold hydrolase n=1 Tax=Agromyces agglutinans TaxID=2662258 RepID=A0A6I2F6W1_9MICO|nr:alpha/beta fold hydrolase [Agromyces agglutinans]MRG60359.1 alpha/beta fold hydrolase [Agromyces agglutinans]